MGRPPTPQHKAAPSTGVHPSCDACTGAGCLLTPLSSLQDQGQDSHYSPTHSSIVFDVEMDAGPPVGLRTLRSKRGFHGNVDGKQCRDAPVRRASTSQTLW